VSTGNDADAPHAGRAPGFPATLLALVDRGEPDDSISTTGRLLERALGELSPSAQTLTVFPTSEGGADPTFLQRARFTARLVSAGRRADCVLFNHAGVATVEAMLPASMRRPHAIAVHGREAWDVESDPSRRRAIARAALLLASSAYTARRVAEANPEARAPEICVPGLPLALDTGAVDGALVSSITSRTIVIAGRMHAAEPTKGHDALLDAWQAVLGRRTDARLAIVGRGDDLKRLEAKATRLGVMGSVRFTGFVSGATLDAMLARAAGFALPSRNEGSPLGFLRAMRAGVPCIASAQDAGSEMVVDGETGLVVSSPEADEVAQAVIALLGDTQRRRTMGDAARSRFERHFSYEMFRERLDTLVRAAFRPRAA
jgi:glycosyltransferase involved in cell wall biosynthesis